MISNTYIKESVQHRTCSVHQQKPSIEIVDNNIDVKCCCSDFRVSCLKNIVRLLIDMTDHSLGVATRSIA